MAIVSVDEVRGARTGSIDAQWRRTYKRVWRVITDHPLDIGALGARLAVPVFFGQPYSLTNGASVVEYDNYAFALKIDSQIDPACNDDCSWLVTVDYGPWDPTQFPENPLNHPIKISFGCNRFQAPLDEDVDGNAVVNSAGDYFDPPPQYDDSRPTIKIVRNEQVFNPAYAMLWRDTLNRYVFFDFPPLTVKMSAPTGELEYSPVCGFYYIVTYEFEVNPDGWQLSILDQGLRRLSGIGQAAITDVQGQPVTSPVLLDGLGGQLPSGGKPVFLVYERYTVADYSLLNLYPFSSPGI